MKKLTKAEIIGLMSNLQFNWSIDSKALVLKLKTKDFSEAIWLVNEIAQVANALNHHPDIELKNYNHLHIFIYSHALNALSIKDFELAEKVDAIVTRIK